MTIGEVSTLGGLLLAIISGLCTAVWKWAKAVEDRAFARAQNEALLREANATIAQKDRELAAKDAVIKDQVSQLDEKQALITSLQQTVDWFVEPEGIS